MPISGQMNDALRISPTLTVERQNIFGCYVSKITPKDDFVMNRSIEKVNGDTVAQWGKFGSFRCIRTRKINSDVWGNWWIIQEVLFNGNVVARRELYN